MQNLAKSRFDNSRAKLSESLKYLEDVIKNKIQETAISAKTAKISENQKSVEIKFIEQEAIIKNLNQEINNLQKSLEQAGKEVEFLKENNKSLGNRLNSIKQNSEIIKLIEEDLLKIEEIINQED